MPIGRDFLPRSVLANFHKFKFSRPDSIVVIAQNDGKAAETLIRCNSAKGNIVVILTDGTVIQGTRMEIFDILIREHFKSKKMEDPPLKYLLVDILISQLMLQKEVPLPLGRKYRIRENLKRLLGLNSFVDW